MAFDSVLFVFLSFSCYAFLGWIMESSLRTLEEGHPVNSGFLSGPFIPIYGFGALFIGVTHDLLARAPFALMWIVPCVIPTVLEYSVSVLFEKAFGLKLWDYSDKILNLKGRVCLLISCAWIGMALLLLLVIRPWVESMVARLDFRSVYFLSGALAAYFAVDTWHSSKAYMQFSRFLSSIEERARKSDQLKALLDSGSRLQKELNRFLKPLRAFPGLKVRFAQWLPEVPDRLRKRLEEALKPRLTVFPRLSDRKARRMREFVSLAGDILESPEFLRLKEYPHHDLSVYDHTLRVAKVSYRFAHALGLNEKETVHGALLHDYYLYDWRISGPDSGKRHPFGHAEQALRNAEADFGPLSGVERDCIERHMWPLTPRIPRHPESWTVSVSDKIVSLFEVYRMAVRVHGRNKAA